MRVAVTAIHAVGAAGSSGGRHVGAAGPSGGRSVGTASSSGSLRSAALLVLRDDEGRIGVGEAAPLPGFSRETLQQAVHALCVCESLSPLAEDVPPLQAIGEALAPHATVLDPVPTARFAIETALLDLLAQRRGVGVASCLGPSLHERSEGFGRGGLAHRGEAPSTRPGVGIVETSALVTATGDLGAIVKAAIDAAAKGFRTIKVKLRATDDASLQREIEALSWVRAALPDVTLRLDPNGRWSIAQARRYLARLACVAPAFVEQPVAPLDLADLGLCAVPWAADESLGIPSVAARLRRESGCAVFILKPAALGIGAALEAARLARERGIDVVVTHFLDGPIGLAAACELALALDPPPLPCGLAPHAGLQGAPPDWLPHHDHTGSAGDPPRPHIARTSRHGLGFGPRAIESILALASPIEEAGAPWTR